jgi:hypothetical protein
MMIRLFFGMDSVWKVWPAHTQRPRTGTAPRHGGVYFPAGVTGWPSPFCFGTTAPGCREDRDVARLRARTRFFVRCLARARGRGRRTHAPDRPLTCEPHLGRLSVPVQPEPVCTTPGFAAPFSSVSPILLSPGCSLNSTWMAHYWPASRLAERDKLCVHTLPSASVRKQSYFYIVFQVHT